MILWKLDALLRSRRVRGRDLAARLGVGENYLSRIRREPPERLSLKLLDALCRELNVGLEELLVQVPDGPSSGVQVALPPPVAVPRRGQLRLPRPAAKAPLEAEPPAEAPTPPPLPDERPEALAPSPAAALAPPSPPEPQGSPAAPEASGLPAPPKAPEAKGPGLALRLPMRRRRPS